MAFWRNKWVVAAGILAVILCIYMESQKSHYSVAEISEKPSLIDGKTVSGIHVDLHIKDVTLRGTTFKKAQLYGAVFENVIFEDCTFSDTLLWEATFKDVLFKNGVFVRKAGDENHEIRSGVIASWLYNVTFDATKFINFDFNGIGGSIRFLNITQVSGYKSAAAMGGGKRCGMQHRGARLQHTRL